MTNLKDSNSGFFDEILLNIRKYITKAIAHGIIFLLFIIGWWLIKVIMYNLLIIATASSQEIAYALATLTGMSLLFGIVAFIYFRKNIRLEQFGLKWNRSTKEPYCPIHDAPLTNEIRKNEKGLLQHAGICPSCPNHLYFLNVTVKVKNPQPGLRSTSIKDVTFFEAKQLLGKSEPYNDEDFIAL